MEASAETAADVEDGLTAEADDRIVADGIAAAGQDSVSNAGHRDLAEVQRHKGRIAAGIAVILDRRGVPNLFLKC